MWRIIVEISNISEKELYDVMDGRRKILFVQLVEVGIIPLRYSPSRLEECLESVQDKEVNGGQKCNS